MMADATEDPEVKNIRDMEFTGVELLDLSTEEVKLVMLNRHERRKRAKLARMIAMKEHLELEKRRKAK